MSSAADASVESDEPVPQAVAIMAAEPMPAAWSNLRRDTEERIPCAIAAIACVFCVFIRDPLGRAAFANVISDLSPMVPQIESKIIINGHSFVTTVAKMHDLTVSYNVLIM